MPKFPHIKVTIKLNGPDGNAYIVMGKVAKAMARGGVGVADIEAYRKAAMDGDYENLLSVSRETVDFDGR